MQRGAYRFGLGAALLAGAVGVWFPGLSAGQAMAPQVGKSFELTRLGGTVMVTVPGGHAATLTGTQQIPVGSTIQASRGIVRLTAANGNGGTYSGQFSRGAFQALQGATGSSATEIKLVGNLCQGTRASSANYHHHGHRYLRASVPPEFEVVGDNGYAQALAGVAKLTLSDACSGATVAAANQAGGETTVAAQSGDVQASSPNHRLQNTVSPGEIDQLRCSRAGGYCVVDEVRLKGELRGIFFPSVATNRATGTYQFCLKAPSKRRSCKPVVSTEPPFEDGKRLTGGLDVVGCQATRIGTYTVSWRLHGVQLGQPLTFHLSSVPKRSFALPCLAYLGNFDANPQRVKLPANVKVVSRLSLPIGVDISNMSVDLAPTGVPGSESVRGLIYADQGGAPGALLAVTQPFRFTSAMPADASYQLEFATGQAPRLAPGEYWMGVISGGDDNVATIGADPLPNSGAANANSYSTGPSNPFGPLTVENDYLAVDAGYATGNS